MSERRRTLSSPAAFTPTPEDYRFGSSDYPKSTKYREPVREPISRDDDPEIALLKKQLAELSRHEPYEEEPSAQPTEGELRKRRLEARAAEESVKDERALRRTQEKSLGWSPRKPLPTSIEAFADDTTIANPFAETRADALENLHENLPKQIGSRRLKNFQMGHEAGYKLREEARVLGASKKHPAQKPRYKDQPLRKNKERFKDSLPREEPQRPSWDDDRDQFYSGDYYDYADGRKDYEIAPSEVEAKEPEHPETFRSKLSHRKRGYDIPPKQLSPRKDQIMTNRVYQPGDRGWRTDNAKPRAQDVRRATKPVPQPPQTVTAKVRRFLDNLFGPPRET